MSADFPGLTSRRLKFNWLVPVLFSVAALAGVVSIQLLAPESLIFGKPDESDIDRDDFVQATQVREQQQALQLQLLKILPTLGYDNLIADWTFLNFLQYFGDEPARQATGYQLNDDYFDVISQLDPRWLEMYLFLSTSVSFYQAAPEVAVELMNRGTAALSPQINPTAWILWRIKGIDQLLLLGDTQGAIQSLHQAADWAQESDYPDFARQFRQAAETLQQNPDNLLVRLNAWLSVYYQTTDELVKQRATQELLALGAKKEIGENGEVRFILPQTP
ncbi:MAG: hypothetical protein WBA77_07155 [Microcoleaceae cyanobacterium]